jgi:hypothetical protein
MSVSLSADTIERIRSFASAQGLPMSRVVELATADIGGSFVWRGVPRQAKPPQIRPTRRARGTLGRFSIYVSSTAYSRLSAIANRRGLTMAGALELVAGAL